MAIDAHTNTEIATGFFAANETMAAYTMTRIWGKRPEEWTLFIHTGNEILIECIQQKGNGRLVVTIAQIALFNGGDLDYGLHVQTADQQQFQFRLAQHVLKDVAWLLKEFLAIAIPDFLSIRNHREEELDAILAEFFGQTSKAYLPGQSAESDAWQ